MLVLIQVDKMGLFPNVFLVIFLFLGKKYCGVFMNVLEISQTVKPYFAPYTAVALQPFICKRIDNRIAESKNTAD